MQTTKLYKCLILLEMKVEKKTKNLNNLLADSDAAADKWVGRVLRLLIAAVGPLYAILLGS